MNYLLIDIGSTFTKGTLVDGQAGRILARAQSTTTVDRSVTLGVDRVLEGLEEASGTKPSWDKALLCSSAAGGLKMVAIGLGRKLTAEAATRAALGAGARILKTYALRLDEEDIEEMDRLAPDILLLAGGTDQGNRLTILDHAQKLTGLTRRPPVVVAGNRAVRDQVVGILEGAGFEVFPTENIMPQVNVLNADPARRVIRSIFMSRITRSKGLDVLEDRLGKVLMPTPDAVLQAARLLSLGTGSQAGLGDLLLVDIGGATTDIHSVGLGHPREPRLRIGDKTYELREEGLQEPLDKRTVEGDLGMRYSAQSLLESVGHEALEALYPADYAAACQRRTDNTRLIPDSPEEVAIDQAMARAAYLKALSRHVGTLRREFTGRSIYYLSGKDLTHFSTIIGTGGVLVHSPQPDRVLGMDPDPDQRPLLYPAFPRVYIDRTYSLSAMGLLAQEDPDLALRLMKEDLGIG
ncbi:MAG: methylaspartate mutase accessory protein GlmL [Firmicutes bacterium]|nr:methylaspartate mutase accessory protein GlmL [Bacillota bacterium]